MGGRSSEGKSELMGAQLAQMHRSLSPNGKYGFHVDNTIGGIMRKMPKLSRRVRYEMVLSTAVIV